EFKHRKLVSQVPYDLYQATDYILVRPLGNSVWSIIQSVIKDQVRLRLMSLKVKRSIHVMKAAELWNVHVEQNFKGKWDSCNCNKPELVMKSTNIEDQEMIGRKASNVQTILDDGSSSYRVWWDGSF
ncbi:hypothetical protein Tco_0030065, partial [Tanacetum coccineum]